MRVCVWRETWRESSAQEWTEHTGPFFTTGAFCVNTPDFIIGYSLRKEDARLQGPFLSALVYWRVHEEMDRPHTPACAGSRSLQLYDVRVIL